MKISPRARRIALITTTWFAFTACFAAVALAADLFFSYGTVAPCSIARQLAMRQVNQKVQSDPALRNSLAGAIGIAAAGTTTDNLLAGASPTECAQAALRLSLDEQDSQ